MHREEGDLLELSHVVILRSRYYEYSTAAPSWRWRGEEPLNPMETGAAFAANTFRNEGRRLAEGQPLYERTRATHPRSPVSSTPSDESTGQDSTSRWMLLTRN